MLIGHFGIAFGLKKYNNSLNLGFLFIAAMLMDLAFVFFILLGIEHMRIVPGFTQSNSLDLYYIPFSHSLLGSIILAISTVLVVRFLLLKHSDKTEAEKSRTALVLGSAVILHYLLDFFVHIPDLLLIPGIDIKVGLGLWNFLIIALALELSALLIGALIYFKSTTANSTFSGKYGMLAFVTFLTFLIIITPFLNPPSVFAAVISTLLISTLLTLIAFWLDRKRSPVNKDKYTA